MKKIMAILLLLSSMIMAQNDSVKVYKSGLYLGASGIYPHYMTITEKSVAMHKNFGFGFHVGYDMTEHFGFRLSTNYVLLSSFWYGQNGSEQENFVNMATLNIDAIYNILPCEKISPYIVAGYGFSWFKSSNPYLGPNGDRDWIKEAYTGNLFEFGLGAIFKFWDDLHIKTEIDYITATNNKIDGNEHENGTKGLLFSNGDSYMNIKIGASWYFSRGEKSKICEPFSIREVITEVPVVVEKIIIDTVYVDKIVEKAIIKKESFVLENVRFKFDKDVLTKEAELILENVARVMNKYPNEKFEILGHTDNWGSDEYNMDLSERRAISVKNYLVMRGVDESRLFPAGCGERKPIVGNDTEEGRAINRRIEFSIYDGILTDCSLKENSEVKSEKPTFKNDEEQEIANKLVDGENLSFTNVRFKVDSDELTEPSKEILDNVVSVLKKLSDLNLEIEGHTDSDGAESYNQDLSERRAQSVKEYLVKNGIDSLRLSTVGFGESKPVVENNSSENKAKNRRIEFKKVK